MTAITILIRDLFINLFYFVFLYKLNLMNFIINYIYALLVLALPVLVFGGFVDIVPTVLLIVIFYIGYRLYSVSSKDNFRDIYALFLAHYFVLVIFEPDVGSYMRHMTSVALYLLVVYYHISKYK
jgi:hypothetical protein